MMQPQTLLRPLKPDLLDRFGQDLVGIDMIRERINPSVVKERQSPPDSANPVNPVNPVKTHSTLLRDRIVSPP